MKARLNNILVLAVTLFCVSCSVTEKLDQNLAEMHEMNKNMAEMNKNMNRNLEEANKNFATLVTTMKPDDWIDHISDRFDQTLAMMMEGTGDIRTLVKNGNDVSKELLAFMSKFSADELKDLAGSITQATGYMKSMNEFMVKHSDDIDILTEQMTIMPQLFVTMGTGMGMIDLKDADALIASMQHESPNEASADEKTAALDLLASSGPVAEKVMFLTKERMEYAQKNNYLRPLSEFAAQLNKESKNAGSIKKYVTRDIMGQFWSAKDAKGNPVPVDKYMSCAMLKMLIEMKNFKSTGSAKASVTGKMTNNSSVLPDGSMTMNGDITNLLLEMESKNPQIIKATYDRYCSDMKNLNFF